jgi:hypothetical protein
MSTLNVHENMQFDVGGWVPKRATLKPAIASACKMLEFAASFDFHSLLESG